MLKKLLEKIKEAVFSVLPVTLIVIILNFTPLIELTTSDVVTFIICAIFLILGIALFSLGAEIAMQPMGESVGSSLMRTNKIKIVVVVCFIMGLLITIAEPDLSVLASQVKAVVNEWVLIVSIGVGVGLFLVFAVLKIIFKKDLSFLLLFFYLVMFAITSIVIIRGNGDFLALSFDSGGVTTGPITVPFIMSLGVGVAATVGGRGAKENSFGLIALCSIGPIIAILILGIGMSGAINYQTPTYSLPVDIMPYVFNTLWSMTKEVFLSLILIVVVFFIIQFIYIKLPKKKLVKILIGISYTFVGLIIFLTAVNVGFMPVGFKIGSDLSSNPALAVILGFVLGMVVVLAEPAVHVLTKQVEEITTGGVSKKSMLIALSIGVGISIGLSVIRIIFDFSILYYIIPGYIISLGLSFFVPKMYTAIAFDSGGVASGPLTSSFILPFAIGACLSLNGDAAILRDGFGIVAMVAMTPLITIQLLGFKNIITLKIKSKNRMRKILDASDEQIINFM